MSSPNAVSYIRRARVGEECGPGTCGIYEGLIHAAELTPIVSVGLKSTTEDAEITHPQETGEWAHKL